MKSLKKTFFGIAAGVLSAALLLTGCGGGDSAGASGKGNDKDLVCLLYTSPSPRD